MFHLIAIVNLNCSFSLNSLPKNTYIYIRVLLDVVDFLRFKIFCFYIIKNWSTSVYLYISDTSIPFLNSYPHQQNIHQHRSHDFVCLFFGWSYENNITTSERICFCTVPKTNGSRGRYIIISFINVAF